MNVQCALRRAAAVVATALLLQSGAVVCEGAENVPPKPIGAFYLYTEPAEIKASVPLTPLPLDPAGMLNWQDAQKSLPSYARDLFARNGFVLFDGGFSGAALGDCCSTVQKAGLPVFISSDAILQICRTQMALVQEQLEQNRVSDDLLTLTAALKGSSQRLYNSVLAAAPKEIGAPGVVTPEKAARLCLAYFSVAHRLLDPDAELPGAVEADAQAELNLIAGHAGPAVSPLFKYIVDYSLFAPTGHYTHTLKLMDYFKACAWYSQVAFLAKGKSDLAQDGLISEEDARVQTLAALTIADMMALPPAQAGPSAAEAIPSVMELWKRIYYVNSFFLGYADEMTPLTYREIMQNAGVPEGGLDLRKMSELTDAGWPALRNAIAMYPSNWLYGGTPTVQTRAFGDEELLKALPPMRGMRLLSTHSSPDDVIMAGMTGPKVGAYNGKKADNEKVPPPLTAISDGQGGFIRGLPCGLDVMTVIGVASPELQMGTGFNVAIQPARRGLAVSLCREVLRRSGEDAYEQYDARLGELQRVFSNDYTDWARSLQWAWLDCLRFLPAQGPAEYPAFMRSAAWSDKEIATSLASWAQMRYDDPSDAAPLAPAGPRAAATGAVPAGYVEPAPELYRRLAALHLMVLRGLEQMNALGPDETRARLEAMRLRLLRLHGLSVRELRNEKLAEEDQQFIHDLFLPNGRDPVLAADAPPALVTDAYADIISGQVLQEATGWFRTIAVACPAPDGGNFVAFGPVFSYFEMKSPAEDRFTAESWRAKLEAPAPGQPPQSPDWTRSFYAPPTKTP